MLPQTQPSSFHGVNKHFRLDVMQPFINIQIYGWPCSPTSPIPARLISPCSKTFSTWCYADCQQRSNERLVVPPQTRPSWFHVVQYLFAMMQCSLLETLRLTKRIEIFFGAALPNIFCFRPPLLWTLNKIFVLMLRGLLKTFDYKAGPCFPKHNPVPFTVLNNFFV